MSENISSQYRPLDTTTVIDYVRGRPELRDMFHENEAIEAVEVGDGNLNLVFKVNAVADRQRTVVVKQALPYVRLVGESWPLPTDRARIESQSQALENQLVPQHSPHLYFYDPEMYLMVMQNLNDHIIMRQGLIKGIQYPHFAEHIGLFLAKMLGSTSDLTLDYRTKKEEVARFINPELCKISEDLIFTEPYRQHERNLFHAELTPQVLALQADESLRVEVAQLKEKFMTQAQALLHGDLHTGSIMVNQTDTYVIDSEFAFYGPIGFDIGALIGNLLLSYASHEVRSKDETQRAAFRKYLTDTIMSVWVVFKREFQQVVWQHVDQHDMPLAYQQDYIHRILQDACGFAGAKMIRRVIGLAGVADIRGIEDVTDRSIAASLALNMGQALIKGRHSVTTIEDIVSLATDCKPAYPWVG